MFFSSTPPPPSFLWIEWLSQEHSWKTFGKKNTRSLRRWRCLGLRITEVQIGSPCQNYSCTKDGTVYQLRAQKDFFRFSRTTQVLRKRSCAVTRQAVLAEPALPPTLKPVSEDANLLRGAIKGYLPPRICHLGKIYYQGIPFMTPYNMFYLFSHFPLETWNLISIPASRLLAYLPSLSHSPSSSSILPLSTAQMKWDD